MVSSLGTNWNHIICHNFSPNFQQDWRPNVIRCVTGKKKAFVHPSRRRRLQQNPIFPSSCLVDECKKERTPPKRVWDQPYALWMPLFNERQQSFHAKNCCCCGLYVRRQRGAPQTISLAGQSFWGWPPRGYDEGELLLLPLCQKIPMNLKRAGCFLCVCPYFSAAALTKGEQF